MRTAKRARAVIVGQQRADQAMARLGQDVRASRKRRRLTQQALAAQVGISRQRLSDLEVGRGAGLPPTIWFAVAEILGRYLRFEFARDPQTEPADAGHLAIQELVLRLAPAAGWAGRFEMPTRPSDPARSVDVPLLDRRRRRLAIVECWNTFGDLGAAARSSDRKVADAHALAASLGGGKGPYETGLCWVIRDTAANRSLLARYEHIFASRLPGSSRAWLNSIAEGGPLPGEPGLIWCDQNATRLFAHRRPRARPPR